jgi:hypothetical protein
MMATTPILRLHLSQVGQLIDYCATYRSYLWQHTLPTLERNQTIRRMQMLQARLEKAQEQAQAEYALLLTEEEKQALKHLLNEMLRLVSSAPLSEQRTQQVAEVAGLRVLVERTFRRTQAL